jgi:hypothetical protein
MTDMNPCVVCGLPRGLVLESVCPPAEFPGVCEECQEFLRQVARGRAMSTHLTYIEASTVALAALRDAFKETV